MKDQNVINAWVAAREIRLQWEATSVEEDLAEKALNDIRLKLIALHALLVSAQIFAKTLSDHEKTLNSLGLPSLFPE